MVDQFEISAFFFFLPHKTCIVHSIVHKPKINLGAVMLRVPDSSVYIINAEWRQWPGSYCTHVLGADVADRKIILLNWGAESWAAG